MREIVSALLYIASSGCAWAMLPKCFPPISMVQRYFYAWRNAGLFETIVSIRRDPPCVTGERPVLSVLLFAHLGAVVGSDDGVFRT